MGLRDHLKQRGGTWYVQVSIPGHLREAAGGKWEFIKSLKTTDLTEANRRKHQYVAAFKHKIAALERGTKANQKPAALAELYDKALAWRETVDRHKGEVLYTEPDGTPYYAEDEFLGQISDEAQDFLESHGAAAATAFHQVATGKGTLLQSKVEEWLAEQTGQVTGQTISQHRMVIDAFSKWAGEGVLIERVDRKRAGEYVGHLLAPSSKLSRTTAKRYVSSLSSLWAWLEARGIAESNPWLRQLGKKPRRGDANAGRKQWRDEALIKVLTGQYTRRYTETLHDLVKLALVTGARLDELCALKGDEVQGRPDGWWMSIRQGKNKAAVRDIPVHDGAAHVLKRRKRPGHGYLFEGLIAGGPDNKRSWNVSKAFGHYTKSLDLGDERGVFHSLRNTFIEAMEAAEVPESTVKLIVGHARQSMTYGHYSKAVRLDLRKQINKLHYSSKLMQLIRIDLKDRKSSGRRQAVNATKAIMEKGK